MLNFYFLWWWHLYFSHDESDSVCHDSLSQYWTVIGPDSPVSPVTACSPLAVEVKHKIHNCGQCSKKYIIHCMHCQSFLYRIYFKNVLMKSFDVVLNNDYSSLGVGSAGAGHSHQLAQGPLKPFQIVKMSTKSPGAGNSHTCLDNTTI